MHGAAVVVVVAGIDAVLVLDPAQRLGAPEPAPAVPYVQVEVLLAGEDVAKRSQAMLQTFEAAQDFVRVEPHAQNHV